MRKSSKFELAIRWREPSLPSPDEIIDT